VGNIFALGLFLNSKGTLKMQRGDDGGKIKCERGSKPSEIIAKKNGNFTYASYKYQRGF